MEDIITKEQLIPLLTLLHSEQPKLYEGLAVLSAVRLIIFL